MNYHQTILLFSCAYCPRVLSATEIRGHNANLKIQIKINTFICIARYFNLLRPRKWQSNAWAKSICPLRNIQPQPQSLV